MKFKIPVITPTETVTWEEYYRLKSQEPALKSRASRCHDCAITTGFYADYAKALMEQPIEIQIKVSKTWDCHNSNSRCCKGIEDIINK